MKFDDATTRQIHAADPIRSSWVSANAGSGKTRVLTNRVARMLFHGVPPAKILCLTYTKAAASEMQIRLFETLGSWSMATDEDLRAALFKLGESGPYSSADLRRARQMFATAIETPGGLKVQTIHAFCASVLRRFPLEAGVTPNFREMDDRATKTLRRDVLDQIALANPQEFDDLLRNTPSDLEKLCSDIVNKSRHFQDPNPATIWSAFGLMPGYSEQSLLSEYRFSDADMAAIREFCSAGFEGTRDREAAAKLQAISGPELTISDLVVLEGVFLTKVEKDKPVPTNKIGKVPTKGGRAFFSERLADLEDLMLRVEQNRPRRLALNAAQRSLVLITFANAFLRVYEERKAATGSLDFDDLINKTLALLSKAEAAEWVMYRLDGGIDHILVDEAQDTSPQQWQIIRCLAGEFTAGHGARDDMNRTIFVVGDRKQSIYSFQGAAPQAFEDMRDAYSAQLKQVETDLQQIELSHSFRSSAAILNFVDVALKPFVDQGIGDHLDHIAFKSGLPGRVDIWPFNEVTNQGPNRPDFSDPVDVVAPDHPSKQLALEIATEIKAVLEKGDQIVDRDGPRPIRPGDFLILVQKRSGVLFKEILRSLKAAGLDVSGTDRLVLLEELAVKDLLSLLSFLALPDNDLALAEIIRSPLLGLSESDLFDIANPRAAGETLWSAFQSVRPVDDPARQLIHDMMKWADVLAPFELLDRVLNRHGGRQKLVGRLGFECEEAIDALLSLALNYESQESPSLVGFLAWVGSDEIKVRRQMDGEGNMIRVMTAHGAKGLESPIVILPDTGTTKPGNGDEVLVDDKGPMWRTNAQERDDRLRYRIDEQKRLGEEERKRLLYVAMTRAESWLIICGAGSAKDDSWYSIASEAMSQLPKESIISPNGVRHRYAIGNWPDAGSGEQKHPESMTQLPDWVDEAAKKPAPPMTVLSPSKLGGDKVISAAKGDGDPLAMERGTALHRLLEILPDQERANWKNIAQSEFGNRADFATLFEEALSVLTNEALSFLFAEGTFAEVPISATVSPLQGSRISGAIDRLVISDERVLVVDYKSNAEIPARVEDTPEGLLRQLGAYLDAVQQVFPDHIVETAILWTRDPSLMIYPHDIVRDALDRTSIS